MRFLPILFVLITLSTSIHALPEQPNRGFSGINAVFKRLIENVGVVEPSVTPGFPTSSVPTYGDDKWYVYAGGSSDAIGPGNKTSSGTEPELIDATVVREYLPNATDDPTWDFGAWRYQFSEPYTYENESSKTNMTLLPVCLCGTFEPCSCDYSSNKNYTNAVANDPSVASVATINGTETLVIDGTLANVTQTGGSRMHKRCEPVRTHEGNFLGIPLPPDNKVYCGLV